MGIFWRSIMPLLSTLAALVILVHTAEEEMEYHDISPRMAEHVAQDYDQKWRAVKTEPIMQKSDELNEKIPEERHRRPGRKRKRRPLTELANESDERRFYHEEPARHLNTEPLSNENVEQTRRRRKRPEIRVNRWTEESTEIIDRPVRRRGQRRKRPKLEEFEVFRSDETAPYAGTAKDHLDTSRPHRNHKNHESDEYKAYQEQPQISNVDEPTKVELAEQIYEPKQEGINFEETRNQRNEDVSLAESSSIESDRPLLVENKNDNKQDKVKDEVLTPEFFEKAKNGAIDPMTLKDILKKSNGSSLSEILQQHNLSLADLLRGKQKQKERETILIVRPQDKLENNPGDTNKEKYNWEPDKDNGESAKSPEEKDTFYEEKKKNANLNVKNDDEKVTSDITLESVRSETNNTSSFILTSLNKMNSSKHEQAVKRYVRRRPEILDLKEDAPKIVRRRPFPNGSRRKLRLKPSPLNPSLMMNRSLNAKRRNQQMYNSTTRVKSTESNVIGSVTTSNIEHVKNDTGTEITTTPKSNDEETTQYITETTYEEPVASTDKLSTEKDRQEIVTSLIKLSVTTVEPTTEKNSRDETTEPISATTINIETPGPTIEITEAITATEKPYIAPTARPKQLNRSELRHQTLTNRLKKKRMRQKISTTISPEEDLTKDLFGMANLVSASEFIAKVQSPKTTTPQDDNETPLEDFMANEASSNVEKARKITPQYSVIRHSSIAPATIVTTTEEIAKIEIEEILNDTDTGARLSKILMERNMTLSELVEHRERGSSQVHLADIFHNTSKEPNPPEPFLSKSLIEPISKETYPLRALLEANHHETTVKPTTIEPYQPQNGNNIPVVMNFGNNVNENGENLGIVSMFNKMITNDVEDKPNIKKDSEGTPYVTSVIAVNVTNSSDNTRDGRDLEMGQSMNLNEIFSFMQRTYLNGSKIVSESFTKGLNQLGPTKPSLEEDHDGDRLIVMEDLQHLKEFENNIASTSEEKIEIGMLENQESRPTKEPGFFDKIPDSTKSVTVATASIVGLTMVVFLMTYVVFRWKQQSNIHRKKESFCEERIPTPVFETRKGNKNQSSMRSISPMLSSNNIYTLNTLDSHTGTESPDYMWDSLRKPFQ